MTSRRNVVPAWSRRRRVQEAAITPAERSRKYRIERKNLRAVVTAKAELIDRIERRGDSWTALANELRDLLWHEAEICQRLSHYWLNAGDTCAAYLAEAWDGHLRTVDAMAYVEHTWLELAEESLEATT